MKLGDIEKVNSLDKLIEARNETVKQMESLRDRFHERKTDDDQAGNWEGDEHSQWKEADERYNAISNRIGQLRNSAAIDERWNQIQGDQERRDRDRHIGGRGSTPEITKETRNLAFQGWLLSGSKKGRKFISERHRDAMEKLSVPAPDAEIDIRKVENDEFAKIQGIARRSNPAGVEGALNDYFDAREQRALSATTPALGETFIPEGFHSMVEINRLAFGGIYTVADVIRTATGNPLPWPTFNDTANTGEWLDESTAVNDTTDPATGELVLNAYKNSSRAILVPSELLQDESVAPRLPQILAAAIAERMGRLTEAAFATGDGTSKPMGLVNSITGFTTSSATASFVGDDIIRLERAVDPAYRKGSSVGYMMHDAVVSVLRRLKDSDNNYIWKAGMIDLTGGTPDRLNGYPLWVNQSYESALTTGNDIMTFGNHAAYKIREAGATRFYRLMERYRERDQDAFLAFDRCDGKLMNAGTPQIAKLRTG